MIIRDVFEDSFTKQDFSINQSVLQEFVLQVIQIFVCNHKTQCNKCRHGNIEYALNDANKYDR